jgi:hypothetical protein
VLEKEPQQMGTAVLQLLIRLGSRGYTPDGRCLPKQLYKIRSSSDVSKDKGTAVFLRDFNNARAIDGTLMHGKRLAIASRLPGQDDAFVVCQVRALGPISKTEFN